LDRQTLVPGRLVKDRRLVEPGRLPSSECSLPRSCWRFHVCTWDHGEPATGFAARVLVAFATANRLPTPLHSLSPRTSRCLRQRARPVVFRPGPSAARRLLQPVQSASTTARPPDSRLLASLARGFRSLSRDEGTGRTADLQAGLRSQAEVSQARGRPAFADPRIIATPFQAPRAMLYPDPIRSHTSRRETVAPSLEASSIGALQCALGEESDVTWDGGAPGGGAAAPPLRSHPTSRPG
jgi:hypothetical protein